MCLKLCDLLVSLHGEADLVEAMKEAMTPELVDRPSEGDFLRSHQVAGLGTFG